MTFNFAPWALDGARTSAASARLATYVTGGTQSGIAQPTDLRVVPLAVPGVGLRVLSGGANVLNRYMGDPDQSYVVSNPATHTVLSGSMPAPQPTLSYYLVCIVVGDQEFGNSGHPFMPSSPLSPEDAADFEYVRIVLIPCSSGTTRTEQLNLPYPAYALARLEVPPNTSTITSAMITDLRKLVQARTDRELLIQSPTPGNALNDSNYSWVGFIPYAPWVEVPTWATNARGTVTLSSFVCIYESIGNLRTTFGPFVGAEVGFGYNDFDGTGMRFTQVLPIDCDVRNYAGQNLQVTVQGYKLPEFGGYITTWQSCQVIVDIQFDERPI